MKIVFIGCVYSSSVTLRKLLSMKCDIVGVVTKKDSANNSDYYDISTLCTENNIPCLFSDDLNSTDEIQWVKQLAPDIIICIGWSNLLKEEILVLPPKGVVGYHPSALPLNRGRHPIIWALALGLEQTASTFFLMDQGADSGIILSQHPVNISISDTAQTLYDKLLNVAVSQLEALIPQLQNGTAPRTPQDESLANVWRKRSKPDGLIDFRMSSRSVYNLIRALTRPYVGAHLVYKNQDVIVWEAAEANCSQKNIEPGKIIDIKGSSLTIKCGEGAIILIDHEFTTQPSVGEYL